MNAQGKLPHVIRVALEHKLIQRLPMTFRPYFEQEIQRWKFKFPYEKSYLENVLGYLDGLSEAQFEVLSSGIRKVERRMKLSSHSFSAKEQTIEEASALSRSPLYLAWRLEVNKFFDQINSSAALEQEQARLADINRLLLLIIPAVLPIRPHELITQWPGAQLKKLIWQPDVGTSPSFLEVILKGPLQHDGKRGPGFLQEFAAKKDLLIGDVWLFEPGTALQKLIPGLEIGSGDKLRVIRLSFDQLKPLREMWLNHIKSMGKTLADADAITDHLRHLDISRWCPKGIRGVPLVQEFVRSLLLSNNGSELFSSAFVEWGTAQAAARARPVVVVAEFGLRLRPKPFTSVAIFENPAKANPQVAPVLDPKGSAIDASTLAYYTYLEMQRYPECRRTACVCLFEEGPYLLVAGSEDFPLWNEPEPITPQRVASILRSWLI